MNKEMNPIIIIAAVVVLVVILGYFGYRASTPPTPSLSTYTPGVPPWLDPKQKHDAHPPPAPIAPPPAANGQGH